MGTRLPLSLLVLLGPLCVIGRANAAPRASERFVPTENSGTTPHLPEIFLGRCWNFQRLWDVSPEVNCTDLWEKFWHAFSYRDPCDQKPSYYDEFFSASALNIPPATDKTLFWSGTYAFAHAYSERGRRYTTLEDTLPGYILNGLQWCGSLLAPGYNDKTCPPCGQEEATVPTEDPFWRGASRFFARRARGDVFVMLNGTRVDASGKPVDAFVNTSFFSMEELPNLDQQAVSTVNVWVMHDLDKDPPYGESCNKGSLIQLDQELTRRGFGGRVICQDDPPYLRHLQCVDNPDSKFCNKVNSPTSKASKRTISNVFLSVAIVSAWLMLN